MKVKKKDKLREKIYDLVYGKDLDISKDCVYHDSDDPCHPMCYGTNRSDFYDKLINLLEQNGVYLDKPT